jgi:hypothetical protein
MFNVFYTIKWPISERRKDIEPLKFMSSHIVCSTESSMTTRPLIQSGEFLTTLFGNSLVYDML